ncbi:MAG TPA: hypothetical protein DCZ74_06795 [Treponema sp.]|nr:hypothetical protein [Treponema sp.]
MAKSVINYQCLACGGGLQFNPTTGKLICEYCDSTFTIEEIEKAYGTQQSSAKPETAENQTEDSSSADADSFDGAEPKWDTENLSSDWGADAANMKEYNCPSCGATIICDATTAATSCPYCDNPTVIETQFSGSLRPDYVIPFKLKKQEAINSLKEFYRDKKLLPKEFAEENHLQEIKGVYVPFWFFNGKAHGRAVFETTTSSSHISQNTETTTVRHFECVREADIEFDKVPVDASEKMPDDMMDSLEPFDYSEMKDFSTAYLPGYLADKYDVSVDKCFERANKRCAETCLKTLRRSVGGYDTCRLLSKNITLEKGVVNYGLLPVYLLYTKWSDQRFLFAVNGQTGKVVGNLPVSKKKAVGRFLGTFLTALVIGGAIAAVILAFL